MTLRFMSESVPLDELMRQQGIHQPQCLARFADPEWVAGEESDLCEAFYRAATAQDG